MRKRLAEFIGTELSYQVGIFTFHSFAEEQIRTNPEVFKNFAFSRAISDIEKNEIIEEILEKGKWKSLQTFASDYHYTRDIISAIDDLKDECIKKYMKKRLNWMNFAPQNSSFFVYNLKLQIW